MGCKVGQSDPIVMQLKLNMSCHLLNVYTKFQIDQSMLKKSPENADGRTDGQTDVFQYEQTHNMVQVWTGKLSELQLPVQNPAREGACTSMSY